MNKVEIKVAVAGHLRSFETELPSEVVKWLFSGAGAVNMSVADTPKIAPYEETSCEGYREEAP
jgi:hypothetical protein